MFNGDLTAKEVLFEEPAEFIPVEGQAHVYRRAANGKFVWLDETGDPSEDLDTVEAAVQGLNAYCDMLNSASAMEESFRGG